MKRTLTLVLVTVSLLLTGLAASPTQASTVVGSSLLARRDMIFDIYSKDAVTNYSAQQCQNCNDGRFRVRHYWKRQNDETGFVSRGILFDAWEEGHNPQEEPGCGFPIQWVDVWYVRLYGLDNAGDPHTVDTWDPADLTNDNGCDSEIMAGDAQRDVDWPRMRLAVYYRVKIEIASDQNNEGVREWFDIEGNSQSHGCVFPTGNGYDCVTNGPF